MSAKTKCQIIAELKRVYRKFKTICPEVEAEMYRICRTYGVTRSQIAAIDSEI